MLRSLQILSSWSVKILNIFYLLHYSRPSAVHIILSTNKDVSIYDGERCDINILLSIIQLN